MDTILEHPNSTESDLRSLLRRTGRALLAPSRFFRTDFPALDVTSLLAFGIGNAWAASVAAFFVQTLNSLLLTQLLDRWMRRLIPTDDAFSVWSLSGKSFLLTSGLTLLGPFLFLVQAVWGALFLFLFARLLIEEKPDAPEAVTYQSALRIRASVFVAEWYTLIPVFGGLLAFLARVVLTVTGVRERYGVSTRRATAVVVAPYILLFLGLLLLAAAAMFALSQVGLQEILDMDVGQLGF